MNFENFGFMEIVIIAILGAIVYGVVTATRRTVGTSTTSEPSMQTANPTKFCFACGQSIDTRAEICPKCGVRQPGQGNGLGTTTASGKNRVTAALFALLLGGLGVHKFYLGKPVQGILYLVFCWTFVPAIIGLVEGILLLTKSDAAFAADYA